MTSSGDLSRWFCIWISCWIVMAIYRVSTSRVLSPSLTAAFNIKFSSFILSTSFFKIMF